MKVDYTTEQCDKYNTANAEAINLGMMAKWEPSDKMLAEEAKEKLRAKSQEEFNKLCGQFWRLVISQLPTEFASLCSTEQTGPQLQFNNVPDSFYLTTRGQIEIYRQRIGYLYNEGPGKLRVACGDWGGEHKKRIILLYKPNSIAKMATDVDFAKRIAADLTERLQYRKERRAGQKAAEVVRKNRDTIYEENKDFFNSVGVYGSDVVLQTDGTIYIKVPIQGDINKLKKIVETIKTV